MKSFLARNASLSRQSSNKIIIIIAAIKKLRLFLTDVNQDYIHSKEKLHLEI